MVYSTTTAREKLLNPKYRKVITYKKTKIDQISVNEIGLGQTSEFLIPSKPSEPRHFADRYRNYVSGLFLAEVQGLPMIVSAPLKTKGSKPVWSESLLELYTFWELMNPDIPFVIGEDQEGKFRVVFPMFKIISPFNGDRLDGESWPKINEALVNAETHFLDDLSFRVDSENAKLAIMLSNNFVISDFGHLGLRFSHFSRQQAGITNRGGRYFDPFIPGDFSYFNIVRAHLMTWMNPDERASALDHLIERNQYNDWFESVFWLSQSEIVFSQRKDFRNYNSMNYEILSGQSAQLIAKGWLSGKSLLRHFEKHGVLEMGFESDSEYLEAAKEFLESEDPRQMVIKRLNSSTRIKYNFMTKEFAIVDPDGLIISYYRLTEDYRSKEEFHEYLGSNIVKR